MKSLKETIVEFNNQSNEFAMFINGDWGTGKTYTVLGIISDFDDVEYLPLTYYESVIDIKRDQQRKKLFLLNTSSFIIKTISQGAFDLGKADVKIGAKGNRKKRKYKKKLIVLDDIERFLYSNDDDQTRQLFALIEELNYTYNVICLVNEEKIKHCENALYYIFKEKYVFRTIDFKIDYNHVIENIFPNLREDYLGLGIDQYVLNKIKAWTEDFCISYEVNNVRLLKYSLKYFVIMLDYLLEVEDDFCGFNLDPKEKIEFFTKFLKWIIIVVTESSKGETNELTINSLRNNYNYYLGLFSSLNPIDSIQSLIDSYTSNKEELVKDVEKENKEKTLSDKLNEVITKYDLYKEDVFWTPLLKTLFMDYHIEVSSSSLDDLKKTITYMNIKRIEPVTRVLSAPFWTFSTKEFDDYVVILNHVLEDFSPKISEFFQIAYKVLLIEFYSMSNQKVINKLVGKFKGKLEENFYEMFSLEYENWMDTKEYESDICRFEDLISRRTINIGSDMDSTNLLKLFKEKYNIFCIKFFERQLTDLVNNSSGKEIYYFLMEFGKTSNDEKWISDFVYSIDQKAILKKFISTEEFNYLFFMVDEIYNKNFSLLTGLADYMCENLHILCHEEHYRGPSRYYISRINELNNN